MVMNYIHDNRIGADNYMLELPIGEYYSLVEDNLNDNEYQRKRVRNASSVYSLLKKDLIEGCVMPPIVLAYGDQVQDPNKLLEQMKKSRFKIKILDGLQRSYTIKEIVDDYRNGVLEKGPGEKTALDNLIRVEVYTGLNKVGILYRMLTLNTGQTQMSTRHQIEIIYSDYKTNCSVNDVVLQSETDNLTPTALGEYRFRDVVDGFTSYLQKDYLTLDRMDILDNVKNLERLAKSDMGSNLFDEYLDSYNQFVRKVNQLAPASFTETQLKEELNLSATPYATSMYKMFNKSQSMTGYGKAVATLQDLGILRDFNHVKSLLNSIKSSTAEIGFATLLSKLDSVRGIAKKIGNDQRLYFYHFFKKLFDYNESSYLDINQSAISAFSEYERIVS